MRKLLVLGAFVLGGLALLLFPSPSRAALTVNLDSMAPSNVIDFSDQIKPEGPAPYEELKGYRYQSPLGTEYQAVFTLLDGGAPPQTPPFLVVAGGEVKSFDYDKSTGAMTVSIKTKKFYPPGESEAAPVFVFAFVATVDDSFTTDGPPHAMSGGYVGTNVVDWDIVPPETDTPGFGVSLTGGAGETGFFRMFLPASMLDWMSGLAGKELAASDLAVFIDDKQASLSIEEMDGGALVKIKITYKKASTKTAALAGQVTKQIVAKEKLKVSLAKEKNVKKGKKAKLYGWLKNGKKNKVVKIKKKLKKKGSFKLWKKAKTNKRGYFYKKWEPKKTAYYKAYFKNKKGKVRKSPRIKLKVRK